MGKRGPKPVDLGLLASWEFEFYKMFRMLRDGAILPRQPFTTTLAPSEIRSFLGKLKAMTPAEYLFRTRKLSIKMGAKVEDPWRMPSDVEIWWAKTRQEEEIADLKRLLASPSLRTNNKGRAIWRDLCNATTYAQLRKACGRWAQLPDVRRSGRTPFPEHVLNHAAEFLRMKRDKRFPKSDYADDSRIDFLARGMAGLLVGGVQPATANERLRNMNHGPGGRFWNGRVCTCWRCSLERNNPIGQKLQAGYEYGLRAFMELSAKVPKAWNEVKSLI